MKTIATIFASVQLVIFGAFVERWYIQSVSAVYGYQFAEPWEVIVGCTFALIGLGILFTIQGYLASQIVKQRVIRVITVDMSEIDFIESITRRQNDR